MRTSRIEVPARTLAFDRDRSAMQNVGESSPEGSETGGKMDIYQLDYILHEPTEDYGWMYRAEAPALQGCVAWGDTPEETLKSLLAVAQAIIQICREDGQALPPELIPPRRPKGTLTVNV